MISAPDQVFMGPPHSAALQRGMTIEEQSLLRAPRRFDGVDGDEHVAPDEMHAVVAVDGGIAVRRRQLHALAERDLAAVRTHQTAVLVAEEEIAVVGEGP